MVDPFTPEMRSWVMSRVRAEDTSPERVVRSLVHRLGFRYRLHRRDLPGKPDLVFSSRRKIVFVNGCFWHGHRCKRGNRMPRTNSSYWQRKLAKNIARDSLNRAKLKGLGWDMLTIWECQVRDRKELADMLMRFLKQSEV